MVLLCCLYFILSYAHLMRMEKIAPQKCIFFYDEDNTCLQPFGKENASSFNLNEKGQRKLQCCPSWLQRYIIGIKDSQGFEIFLDRTYIANIIMNETHPAYKDQNWNITCLPTFANFSHLKSLIDYDNSLFPDGTKKDFSDIFNTLNLFEKNLFIKQRLDLRRKAIYFLHQFSKIYQKNNTYNPQQMMNFLDTISSAVDSQYKKNIFLYKGVYLISLCTGTISLLITYYCICNMQLPTPLILAIATTGFSFFYTGELIKNTTETYNKFSILISKIKKSN